MLHAEVAEHTVLGSAPGAILTSTISELVKSLPQKLGTSVSSAALALPTDLVCDRRDPAERRQAVRTLPAAGCEPNAMSKLGASAAPAPRRFVKRCASGCCFMTSAIWESSLRPTAVQMSSNNGNYGASTGHADDGAVGPTVSANDTGLNEHSHQRS